MSCECITAEFLQAAVQVSSDHMPTETFKSQVFEEPRAVKAVSHTAVMLMINKGGWHISTNITMNR